MAGFTFLTHLISYLRGTMFNKTVQSMGKTFLIAAIFLALNISSSSWASNGSGNMNGDKAPDFISQIDDNVYAQTSDVTIKLEKKLPKAGEEWPNSLETAQRTMKSSQDPDDYEDLEDPFAGTEKDIPILTDPLEGYNRWMFGVNETIYDAVLEPVARGYRDTVHEHLRIGIKNIFSNALAPVKFVSSLLQLEFKKSGRVLARTLINTTVGIGGIADVAGEEYGIEDVNEDFDQAMGYYGIPTGPYIVLPFFGPSTARNIIGRTADAFMSPGSMAGAGFGLNAGVAVEDNVNAASFIVDDKKQLEDSALDEYESVRDFYHQYRHGLLKK
jgi:phospholipid-binding lipoprotein MlaA